MSRIGEPHRISRLATTNRLDSSRALRCRCILENIKNEVGLPMSMLTVVRSTFSVFQMTPASSLFASSDHSWK